MKVLPVERMQKPTLANLASPEFHLHTELQIVPNNKWYPHEKYFLTFLLQFSLVKNDWRKFINPFHVF